MNKTNLLTAFTIFSKIIAIGLSILSLYWIYLKLTNHSPTIADIAITVSLTHLAISIPFFVLLSKQITALKITMKYEFMGIKREISDMKLRNKLK
ncbi:MAG: hypothetical protein AABX39_01810 [Nanoarchaeota archaeon]